MQISPADEQVLSLFSSLEKQSLYQVVCAATPTDGTRNAYEKAAIKEIVEVIKLTDTEMKASRRLTNNIMIDTLRNMSQMKKMYVGKFMAMVMSADNAVSPQDEAFFNYMARTLELPDIDRI